MPSKEVFIGVGDRYLLRLGATMTTTETDLRKKRLQSAVEVARATHTQKEIAKAIGVSETAMSSFMRSGEGGNNFLDKLAQWLADQNLYSYTDLTEPVQPYTIPNDGSTRATIARELEATLMAVLSDDLTPKQRAEWYHSRVTAWAATIDTATEALSAEDQ